jgi:hypothetical protein
MNKKINYRGILERIEELKSDELNSWESDCINNLLYKWTGEYTDRQKEVISNLNKKYIRGK